MAEPRRIDCADPRLGLGQVESALAERNVKPIHSLLSLAI
jgi:hypothetical protein